jgi:hypothetical protein
MFKTKKSSTHSIAGTFRTGLSIIPNMLEILDSYLALAGRLSEITACTVAYGKEGAGRCDILCFAHAQ